MISTLPIDRAALVARLDQSVRSCRALARTARQQGDNAVAAEWEARGDGLSQLREELLGECCHEHGTPLAKGLEQGPFCAACFDRARAPGPQKE